MLDFDAGDILGLAITLSMLSYYLGLTLFSAPLPTSVKRFGLRMAYQGGVSALFASLYTTIVYSVELLLSSLGVGWSALPSFYTSVSIFASELYAMAAGLLTARPMIYKVLPNELKASVDLVMRTAVQNLLKASTLIGFSLASVEVVAAFIYRYWTLLLLLGILLYSIPGGVGRKVGASLVATAIVLYVALPFLPSWVSLWVDAAAEQNPIVALLGVAREKPTLYLLWGHVMPEYFSNHAYTVALWRGGVPYVSKTSGIIYWFPVLLPPGAVRLEVYSGYVKLVDTVVLIPDACVERESPKIDVFTVLYLLLTQIFKANIRQCQVDIHVPRVATFFDHIVIVADERVKLFVTEWRDRGGVYEVEASARGQGVLTVYTCCGCNATIQIDSMDVLENSEGRLVLRVAGHGSLNLTLAGCESGFSDRSAIEGGSSPLSSLVALVLHDIPLAAYTLALAYTMGVWSFYGLVLAGIYGFSRVLGEVGLAIIRVRY